MFKVTPGINNQKLLFEFDGFSFAEGINIFSIYGKDLLTTTDSGKNILYGVLVDRKIESSDDEIEILPRQKINYLYYQYQIKGEPGKELFFLNCDYTKFFIETDYILRTFQRSK